MIQLLVFQKNSYTLSGFQMSLCYIELMIDRIRNKFFFHQLTKCFVRLWTKMSKFPAVNKLSSLRKTIKRLLVLLIKFNSDCKVETFFLLTVRSSNLTILLMHLTEKIIGYRNPIKEAYPSQICALAISRKSSYALWLVLFNNMFAKFKHLSGVPEAM